MCFLTKSFRDEWNFLKYHWIGNGEDLKIGDWFLIQMQLSESSHFLILSCCPLLGLQTYQTSNKGVWSKFGQLFQQFCLGWGLLWNSSWEEYIYMSTDIFPWRSDERVILSLKLLSQKFFQEVYVYVTIWLVWRLSCLYAFLPKEISFD